jgi:transposase-like protein
MATNPRAAEAADVMRPGGVPDPEVPARAKSRTFSAAYKNRVLAEYDGLGKAGKGALLRREGLYSSLLSEWRRQRDQGALEALTPRKRGRPEGDPRDRELARLRQRERDLELELSKAQRVIEIQGNLSSLLRELAGEGDKNESGRTR